MHGIFPSLCLLLSPVSVPLDVARNSPDRRCFNRYICRAYVFECVGVSVCFCVGIRHSLDQHRVPRRPSMLVCFSVCLKGCVDTSLRLYMLRSVNACCVGWVVSTCVCVVHAVLCWSLRIAVTVKVEMFMF